MHGRGDLRQRRRLREERFRAEGARAALNLRSGVRGQDDHARAARVMSYEAQDLQPFDGVAPGETQVGDDDGVMRGGDQRFGFFQLARAIDVKAFPREELLEGGENDPLVFDEEHSRSVAMLCGMCHGRHYRNGETMDFGAVPVGVKRFAAVTYGSSCFVGGRQDFEISNTDFEYLRNPAKHRTDKSVCATPACFLCLMNVFCPRCFGYTRR